MSDWVLSFDASTPVPAIALGRIDGAGDALIGHEELHARANQASTLLVPAVTALVDAAGIGLPDLATIACGRGPGTFTGTRVAAATAMGLALGLGVEVLAISTLAALAAAAEGDGRVLALLDARRDEVYGAFFELRGMRVQRVGDERCTTLAQLLADPLADDAGLRLIGPGIEPYLEQVPPGLRPRAQPCAGLSAAGLWRATASARRTESTVPPGALEVRYLRASYAEMGIHSPRRPVKRSPFLD